MLETEEEGGEEEEGEEREARVFNCGQCEFTYRTIKEFMAHVKAVPGHQPVCVECDSRFGNLDNLRHHLRKYHVKSRAVVCRDCGKVSRSSDQQYHHWNYVHKVESDLFCNLCGQECQNMFKLRQHTKKCLTKDPVKTARDRLENEGLNRSSEQVVRWSYREYCRYREGLEREREEAKSGQQKQETTCTRRRGRDLLSQERTCSEEEELVKKFKPESGEESDHRDRDSPELDIDKLLEVKYEADSEVEDTEAQPSGDDNCNNNLEDRGDWSNPGSDLGLEVDEEDRESLPSDEEGFHPTDFLQSQADTEVGVEETQFPPSPSSPSLAQTEYRFECSDCRETFKSLSTLKRHKREEHSREFDQSQRNVRCPICSETFFSEQTLRRHKRKHHPEYKGDPKYSCSECEEKFYKYLTFREHLREVHSLLEENEDDDEADRMFKCPSCPESFFSESSLKRHRRKFHPETLKNAGRRRRPEAGLSWACNECSEVLKSQSSLKAHKKAQHQKRKKCNMCEELVLNLPQHRLDVHPEIMAVTEGTMAADGMCVCPYCSKQIATQQHLESHIKRMHEELLMKSSKDVMDSLYCVECGTTFESARAVRLHRKATHDRHLHVKVCPQCAKEVMNLQKHIRDAHPDPDCVKDWPCKDCALVFRTTRDLRYHRAKVHEKEICPFCGKLATKEHIEYVHRVAPVQCDLCLAELKNKRALRNHKNKVHAPPEVLRCQECGQLFDNKIKLYAHNYAVHSYQESRCEWCGGTYKNKKLLQAHKRVMHRDLYIGRDTKTYQPTDSYNAGDKISN